MSYILQNVHWFILLIGALVTFHELGHFLVAKAFNVKVLRFSLGMGPRLLAVRRGETEYTVSLLPLGGYVKMLGDVPGAEIPADEAARAFSNKPVWQRTFIVAAGPMANFLLALIVYFGMFVGPHTFGDTRLGVVTQNEPAWNAGVRPGDKVVAVGGQPVDRWDDLREAIASRPDSSLALSYERHGVRHDVQLVTQARDEENAFQETETRGKIGVSLQYLKPLLGVVDPQSPAAKAGLQTGDVITSVNGTPVGAWHEVRELVAALPPTGPLTVVVQRGDAPVTATLTPEAPAPGLPTDIFSAADMPGGYTGLVNKDALVAKVDAGTPAAGAGVQVGDRLLELTIKTPDGREVRRPVGVWGVDLTTIGLDTKSDLVLTYQRGREVFTRSLRLQAREEKDEFKNVRTTYVFGAQNDPDVLDTYTFERQVDAMEALVEAVRQVGDDMTLIGRGIAKIVQGNLPLNTMGGPIMLFVIAEKSAKRGWQYFLRTLAMISVNLGMLNVLPIPVLDGGHLLFFGIEAVSRRPPSIRTREVANVVGLALLLLLMVLVFRNDFLRFVLG
jgi:regulator of sigma E protease